MPATLLSGPDNLLRAYAEADRDWSSYKTTGNVEYLRSAADRLCGAGQAVLADYGFWAALETDLGAPIGPAWSEFVQNRQRFLQLEQDIVLTRPQMEESAVVGLICELEGAIGSFVVTAETSKAASHIIQTTAFRSRFEELNGAVCAARNASPQATNEPPGNVFRRMGSAVFRARKAIGGIGLIGLNSAVGVGAIPLPFVIPVAVPIVSGSITGGATMLLS